ncbi:MULTISPECIES: SMP-30/gluconolactonase/LRE family protein [unclassified Halomonas]|uniref:SMP-30/gluconolactonase/LRE family protein n=1 Tax=unclassified Halomonas TaxID=2609666 RepID=UPI002076BB00|nr:MULTISPECIES: SMP-30/gluconolactonase/LRE family protein [unclassified Halomonas]
MTHTLEIKAFECVSADLGECPIWDARSQHLWMMDCRKGRIFEIDTCADTCTSWSVPAPAGAFAINEDGKLLVALKEQLVLLERASGGLKTLAKLPESHEHLRFNDGVALDDGGFLVGTMHIHRKEHEPPKGGIFRLDCDGTFSKVGHACGVANGPNLGPFDQRLYIADSACRRIDSFAVSDRFELTDQRLFVDTDTLGSAPDGCCFDSQGGLWSALVRAGSVVRFDHRGDVSHRIDLPVSHPSSLCFGGPDGDDLFVTSIRNSERITADGPLDGKVLQIKGVGFTGLPRPRCRIDL